ncbi:MAG: OmpA family protein [Bacteroidales bacterium]|nr:OmpA family protein [Bacteroidales bacterium]
MKKVILTTVLAAFCMSFTMFGQQAKTAEEVKAETLGNYSHWTLGINGGIPFTQGDFTSFAYDKTYFGFIGGLQLGYQFNPIFGLSLTGDYGINKMGAKDYEENFVLGPNNATVAYSNTLGTGDMYFKDLYSQNKYFMAGLHFDVNLVNLLSRTTSANRRFAVILSPAIYGQKFNPEIKQSSNDQKFGGDINDKINLGLGGDLVFRYRASSCIDLQLKCFGNWIDNQHFDGIINTGSEAKNNLKYNWMAGAQIGVIWKFGGKAKKDNVLWAPTKFEPVAAPAPVAKQEEKPVVKEEPKVEPAPVVKKTVLPEMPSVHFVRNSSKIDTKKYASQLAEILKVLNEYPDTEVYILGYADKTGTVKINDRISLARAEALKTYLVQNGISANRIKKVEGEGVAPLSGEEVYSVAARKAVVLQYGE